MSNEFTSHNDGQVQVCTDIDEATIRIEKAEWYGRKDGTTTDLVITVREIDGTPALVYADSRELIAAIKKAAGIEDAAAKPEDPLWTEVRERPARAVEITPELVRRLAGGDVPRELAGLEPEFDRATGEPTGVIVFDRPGLARIGRYVVLSGAHGTSVLKPEEFERLFEEVPA